MKWFGTLYEKIKRYFKYIYIYEFSTQLHYIHAYCFCVIGGRGYFAYQVILIYVLYKKIKYFWKKIEKFRLNFRKKSAFCLLILRHWWLNKGCHCKHSLRACKYDICKFLGFTLLSRIFELFHNYANVFFIVV